MNKAFDNSVTTKWFVAGHAGPTWIDYQFASGATYAIDSYTITSGNDAPERDPRAWQLQGSKNGIDWVTLDERANQVFDMRYQTNTYDFTNAAAYPIYRLNIVEPAGSDFQLAEIQLFGPPGPAPEAGADAASDVAPADGAADVSSDGANDP
jgi:hypothetical protein